MTNAIKDSCSKCAADDWRIGRAIHRNGSQHAVYFCGACGGVTTHFAPKPSVKAFLRLPLVYESTLKPMAEECEVCGKVGAVEVHHWAPWFLFGQEAEQWPKSYLCRLCHVRWHQVVTPNYGQLPNKANDIKATKVQEMMNQAVARKHAYVGKVKL